MTEEFTPEEMEELQALGVGAPVQQEKRDIFAFLNKIITPKRDVLKTGNLDTDELNPVRVLRDAAVLSNIMGHDLIGKYFVDKADVILSSSLSKQGFLIDMAVTTKRENMIGQKSQGRKNEGWFKKKE